VNQAIENPKTSPADLHEGHRQRLREKFVKSGLSGFHVMK
jgi:hypothetical protein